MSGVLIAAVLIMSSHVNNRQSNQSSVASWLAGRPILIEVLVPALTVMFGLQVLRVLVPGLTWILGDRLSLGAAYLGGVALEVNPVKLDRFRPPISYSETLS